MSTETMTLKLAAAQLQVNPRKLYAELRNRKILGSQNIALPKFVSEGLFRIAYRKYSVHQRIEHQYAVTLVTPKGMSLLQEIVDAMGTDQPVLPKKRRGVSGQHGASEQPAALHRMEADTQEHPTLSIARRTQH